MSLATRIKKHDFIIIKNHPEFGGQMFCIKRAKADGWVETTEGHLFEPTFFDPVSDWQNYNGGVARFNGATGEVVEEKDIEGYLQGKGWCDEVAIACELELGIPQVKAWLHENVDLVEGDGDGKWRLKNLELSIDDKLVRLRSLEAEILEIRQVIINSFYEIGIRLRTIRDERLYELKHYPNFKKYVERELAFSRDYAYKKIAATQVLEDILPSMVRLYTQGIHEKTGVSDVYTQGIHEKTGVSVVRPQGSHEEIGVSVVRPLGSHEIGEKHLRPLTDESLTPDDRREIWERVEDELDEIEEDKQKPPKLTTKIVEKAIANWKIDKNQMPTPTFTSGQICKVKLGGSIGVKELTPFDGKLVRVVEQLKHGVKCAGFWGEEIEEHFRFEELFEVEDADAQRQSVTLPVGLLKELAKRGQSIEDAIANLLEVKS
jgi:hypothetical protein